MTFEKIREWAEARNLVKGSTQQAQMLKLTEELGELAAAVARNNEDGIIDAIGDCCVVLIILAAQRDMRIEACVDAAYEEIRHRTGRMENGIFVKDAA